MPPCCFLRDPKSPPSPFWEQLDGFKCQRQVTTVRRKSIGGQRDDQRECRKNDSQKTAGFHRSRYSISGNLVGVLDLCDGATASRHNCPKERRNSGASSSGDVQDRSASQFCLFQRLAPFGGTCARPFRSSFRDDHRIAGSSRL